MIGSAFLISTLIFAQYATPPAPETFYPILSNGVNGKLANELLRPLKKSVAPPMPKMDPHCAVNGNNSALIVIDMQAPFLFRGNVAMNKQNARGAQRVHEEQLRAIKHAKAQNMPIIFVEYENHGPTDPKLKAAADGYSKSHTVTKSTDGIFDPGNSYKQDFGKLLHNYKIKNLVVTGANGGACVFASIHGALANNCNVTAVSSGIADYNYKRFMTPYPYDGHQVAEFEKAIQEKCVACSFEQVHSISDYADDTSEEGTIAQ